jgi:predicted lipoprotein
VLAAIAMNVVTPDLRRVAGTSAALARAVAELTAEPSTRALLDARVAFRAALLAWKRAHAFGAGPLADTGALVRATFWPARPKAIESALSSVNAIDPRFVDELGVDAKGLYALEYLLFPLGLDEPAAAASFGGNAARRRRDFSRELAVTVAASARNVAATHGDGTAYAQHLARGGQRSVSLLVAQMISTVEGLSANRLELVLGSSKNHWFEPSEVEGWRSGTSRELVLAELSLTDDLYRNHDGGLADLVRAVSPAIHGRLEQKFDAVRRALQKLELPLERAVELRHSLLVEAGAAMKELEVTMKSELTNALGVTLTFQTTDGD